MITMNEEQLLQSISKLLELNTSVIEKRLEAIEQEQHAQKEHIIKVESNIENTVIPRLELLYEGHTTLLHQLEGRAENERLEEAESNIRLHADVIKHMNQDMQEIKVDIVKIKADISGLKQA